MAATAPCCLICRSILAEPRQRRVLKPASQTTAAAARFLARFVSASATSSLSERVYSCRACFSKLEKGSKAVDTATEVVNELRRSVSSTYPVTLVVRDTSGQEQQYTTPQQQDVSASQSSQVPEPGYKRPSPHDSLSLHPAPAAKRARLDTSIPFRSRRSLSFTPVTSSSAPVYTPGNDGKLYLS